MVAQHLMYRCMYTVLPTVDTFVHDKISTILLLKKVQVFICFLSYLTHHVYYK